VELDKNNRRDRKTMALSEQEIKEYLKENKSIVLATIDEDGQTDLRSLGGYNFDGFTLYFGTAASANKVKQIANNNKVSVLVQHEGQVIPQYKNITIYGEAKRLTGDEYELGKAKIIERRPNAVLEEDTKHIYKVIAEKIKILDFTETPEKQTTVISLY
jgi:nitroimidazol reductase NimA-like FMN-containing flavoprotein (pyridoxamine 5'-phosphate oxidase superfamily)